MAARPPASVLFVDDDEANREAFSWVLRSAGFQPRQAATGLEAIRLASEKPDLIVLDVSLPDISGFEVCRRIKAHPATSAIPILHLSGTFVSPQDRTQALDGGADGYLTKPVEAQEFVATVKALLRLHEVEEAARRAADEWQATFDGVSDAMCLVDAKGCLLRGNRALIRLLGKPLAHCLGRPCPALLKEALGEASEAIVRTLSEPPGQRRELLAGKRWFRVTTDAVPAEAGTSTGQIVVLADVTARKELEEQLLQAQKLEAVGRLAGGIAHDFNNLLTAILGNLSLALRDLSDEHTAVMAVRMAEQAAWHAAELTQQLLGFSRRVPLQPRTLDLNDCMVETITLLSRTIGTGIQVSLRAGPGLWPVSADPAQMKQVLMNLVLNARDAMPNGGQIVVETANVVLDEEQARMRAIPPADSREFVRLQVIDTGEGIPPEVQARIFEPFFTTKDVGQGTGLGLAVVHGIVQQHRGWIECVSRVGEGTWFSVYLPRDLSIPDTGTENVR